MENRDNNNFVKVYVIFLLYYIEVPMYLIQCTGGR